ncbi:MAG: D-alanyl-D-alanine carboxypeptidase [Bacteroidetes bacterium]|nr:MAG: D-alanyl-D-alanine carboxypeptidase [Bacteroidota bacterium]
MQHLKLTVPFLLLLAFGFACTPNKYISKKELRTVEKIIEDSPVFSQQFTGFELYDPVNKISLISKNGHKYFTPASNTKILSLYTALTTLGDSLPLLNYIETEEALYFWGTGNPLFLHPDFDTGSEALEFLKSQNKPLRFVDQNFKDTRFGDGWMWDDYPFYYQVEKSALPIYGNAVRFTLSSDSDQLEILPAYFTGVSKEGINSNWFYINREEYLNWFEYHIPQNYNGEPITKEVPFITSEMTIRNLLSDTLKRKVLPAPEFSLDTFTQWETLFIPMPDTLYRRLMHESDNFIAEQLLLMCSNKVLGYQKTITFIEYAKQFIFTDLPDELLWYDGSGLTRYNMFTPRSLVTILDRMRAEFSEERLLEIFPAGGQSGTIENYYGGTPPFVFAKTGTLRNNHCLSGYIKTDSGQTLIFSFMNNHYKGGSDLVKKEMEKVLRVIKEQF